MAYSDDIPPQGLELRDRVSAKTSNITGHLEDQSLDLDARALALLGKRERLKVSRIACYYISRRSLMNDI